MDEFHRQIDSIDKITTTFNKDLRHLLLLGKQYLANDYEFIKIRDQIKLLIKNTPIQPLELIGPYLFKYRAKLQSNNAEFFADIDFTQETTDQEILKFIGKIKQIWNNSSTSEQEKIRNLLLNMLTDYCSYTTNPHRKR